MKIRYGCVTCRRPMDTDAVVYECPRCAAGPSAGPGRAHPRGYLSVVFTPCVTPVSW